MSKDLTKLSRKELETKLRKKYGVDKYLNQRSQLLSLLGMKGETDIETGFTGPETEALSIMFENIKKAVTIEETSEQVSQKSKDLFDELFGDK